MRLGVSGVYGIGVFAIRAIARGTMIFANDQLPVAWIDKAALARAAPSAEEARLYHDFGINKGDRIGCPVNFNYLTPSWYLNAPPPGAEANVTTDAELNFRARRDIAQGEELWIDYAEFSEPIG